jgi:hypothetical protein
MPLLPSVFAQGDYGLKLLLLFVPQNELNLASGHESLSRLNLGNMVFNQIK